MLALLTVTFALLALGNWLMGGRVLAYPPVLYCASWGTALGVLLLSGDLLFHLTDQTIATFLLAAISFSAGSYVALWVHLPTTHSPARTAGWPLSHMLTGAYLMVPFFLWWLFGIVSGSGWNILSTLKTAAIAMIGTDPYFTFFGTVAEIVLALAMISVLERKEHPRRARFALLLAVPMSVFTGQKLGPIYLGSCLLAVEWMRTRQIRWKAAISLLIVLIVLSAALIFYVNLGGEDIQKQFTDVRHAMVMYESGALVAFDRVVRDPNIVPHIDLVGDYVNRIKRKLGLEHGDIPIAAQFVNIGPADPLLHDNVYTWLWSYQIYGLLGMLSIVAAIGFVVTSVYRRALLGNPVAIMFYAALIFGVVFSVFNEYFISRTYYLLKLFVICWIIYRLPEKWSALSSALGNIVYRDAKVHGISSRVGVALAEPIAVVRQSQRP